MPQPCNTQPQQLHAIALPDNALHHSTPAPWRCRQIQHPPHTLPALLTHNHTPLRRYTELFAEEVVRGGPGFALSLVLSAIEPTLRAAAELGAWQLISPVNALGRVVVVNGLHEVQDDVRLHLDQRPCIAHAVHAAVKQCVRCIF